jgi:hypothetical protein
MEGTTMKKICVLEVSPLIVKVQSNKSIVSKPLSSKKPKGVLKDEK